MRNPAYDGPMGIFDDYEGCDSGIDTTPEATKKLSDFMTIHALEAEVLAMVPELRQSVLMDEFNTQNHKTREQVYAAADAKVRPIYLQILELLAQAHGFESYEAALEAQAQDECERADEKFYGGA